MEVEKDVGNAGTDTANKIEEQVREVAKVVFYVVSKDPEKEHVSGDVQKAAVQEHAGDDR